MPNNWLKSLAMQASSVIFRLIHEDKIVGEMTNAKPVQRKRGRPPGGPHADKAATLTTRIRKDTREALDVEARRAGRSLSQEVEVRLRDSLALEARIEKIINAFGGPETYAFFAMAAHAIKALELGPQQKWFDDPYRFAKAVEIIEFLLAQIRPPGEIVAPSGPTPFSFLKDEQIAGALAVGVIVQVLSADEEPPIDGARDSSGHRIFYSDMLKRGPSLKKWLGRLVERLKLPAPGQGVVLTSDLILQPGARTFLAKIPAKRSE
jgi:hypothetical protein